MVRISYCIRVGAVKRFFLDTSKVDLACGDGQPEKLERQKPSGGLWHWGRSVRGTRQP